MPDPFKQSKRQKNAGPGESGESWASDYLKERLRLLGYDVAAVYPVLLDAYGDPDVDDSARMAFVVGDVGLRSMVAIAHGEDPDAPLPVLPDDPTFVASDYPEEGPDMHASVPALLDWVGDNPDRARQVRALEEQQDHPRSTLVAALVRVIGD